MRISTPAAAFAVFLAAQAGAESRLGGILEMEAAVETSGGAQKAELTTLQPELEWRTRWGFDLTAIGRLRTDGYDRLAPGTPDDRSVDPWTRGAYPDDHTELELRELYVDAYLGRSYLRLGKQQIVWGQADGLKVLDLVNPQSFREFILDEFEDSRIPLWSVKWEVPLGETWRAQWLWIPNQTYHQVPGPGAVFEITSPELVPQAPAGAPVTQLPARVPHRRLRDADAGLQLSAYTGGWDVTLNYLYHYADTPVVVLRENVGGVTAQAEYYRTHTTGGTLSNAFGDFTVRAEAGYSTGRRFTAFQAPAVPSDELSYVVGVDWMGLTDTLISMQVFQSRADVDARAVRDSVETDVTLLAERKFRNDTLTLSVLAVHDADQGDGVVTAEIGYDYLSNLRLRLEVSTFYGDRTGRFGQFDRRDRVLVGLEYGL